MTQIFQKRDGNSRMIPATILVVKKGGNVITDKKWPEKHGYYSCQVGYDRYIPPDNQLQGAWAARIAQLVKNDIPPLKKLKEFRMRPNEWDKFEIGDKVVISDHFSGGSVIDVHGRTKGKGFQGAIRRWGHQRGPMTHGSKHHRRYGSVGAGTTPGRVLPRKKMPGWMGDRRSTKTCRVLKVIDKIDEDNMPETIVIVSGSVPGYSAFGENGGSYVWCCQTKKTRLMDGRYKRDPVWLWYTKKGEDVDKLVPLKRKAWAWKTFWGRELRWITGEVKKYWPDGFPGYDHSCDPFYDGCNPHDAIKAPEW
jgi:large subunit ribosomal protein L3